jgi:hypothetical protein
MSYLSRAIGKASFSSLRVQRANANFLAKAVAKPFAVQAGYKGEHPIINNRKKKHFQAKLIHLDNSINIIFHLARGYATESKSAGEIRYVIKKYHLAPHPLYFANMTIGPYYTAPLLVPSLTSNSSKTLFPLS